MQEDGIRVLSKLRFSQPNHKGRNAAEKLEDGGKKATCQTCLGQTLKYKKRVRIIYSFIVKEFVGVETAKRSGQTVVDTNRGSETILACFTLLSTD